MTSPFPRPIASGACGDPETVTLTGVAHGGEAVGRVEGLVAFVRLGLPGEVVRVEPVERKARFLRGRAIEVLAPSPVRTTAPCPIFGTCGGCHWQHATYSAQLEFKTQVLRDQLARLAGLPDPPVEPPVPSPQEWHYRNTVQLVPDSRGGARLLCFRQFHSHQLVPVEHCYISDELINRCLGEAPWAALDDATWSTLGAIEVRVVPHRAVQLTLAGKRLPSRSQVEAFAARTREAIPQLAGVLVAYERGGRPVLVWGTDTLEYELAGFRLAVPAGTFIQVNLGAAERLVEQVLAWLEPGPADVALDAYAGAGTFTLPLARRAAAVTAIEAQVAAAEAAAANAAAAGLANVAVHARLAEDVMTQLQGTIDLAVLDPPRRGCSAVVLAALARLRPRRIAYVSCEPSTLARDVRFLVGHGYRLARARVVDMFPQTYHLESVSLLERR